ncbi:MAG: rhodanese-like domain-containing protein [Phycisphaerales bacterium]|jgi:rhodanese-related sulfurtransferase|nr:rhodanese-like domain-containing protein [Phycisphaerales bacterium]
MTPSSTFARRTGWCAAAALITVSVGCSKSYSDKDVHWLSIEDARSAIADTGGSWISEPTPNAWIDPRDEVFYRVGHIPGALNVQLSDPGAYQRLSGFGTLVVYGEGYEAPLADALIKALLKGGMKDVKGLKVGYEGWIAAGEKIEKGEDAARAPGVRRGDRWQRQPVEDE